LKPTSSIEPARSHQLRSPSDRSAISPLTKDYLYQIRQESTRSTMQSKNHLIADLIDLPVRSWQCKLWRQWQKLMLRNTRSFLVQQFRPFLHEFF